MYGVCTDVVNGYTCACDPPYYTGVNCETGEVRLQSETTVHVMIIITRVASYLARSDTPSITCIVACLSRSDTPTLL